jgi:hypothetical protein
MEVYTLYTVYVNVYMCVCVCVCVCVLCNALARWSNDRDVCHNVIITHIIIIIVRSVYYTYFLFILSRKGPRQRRRCSFYLWSVPYIINLVQ